MTVCAAAHGTTAVRAHYTGTERATGLGLGLGYLGRNMNLDVATWPQEVGVFSCHDKFCCRDIDVAWNWF